MKTPFVNSRSNFCATAFFPLILRSIHALPHYKTCKIADFGCGTGYLTHILSHHVHQVIGVDSSSQSVNIAREYNKDRPNVAIEQSSFEDFGKNHQNEFDFALSHMALQTTEILSPAIESISLSLKNNGIFLFSVPHPCFWALIKDEIGKGDYQYSRQSRHYNTFKFTSSKRFCSFDITEAILVKNDQESNQYASKKV